MFDVSKIQNSLSGLVGFKQPLNPDYAIVDAPNQLSESGYFVNSNPYAKMEYIKDCQDYKDISDADFNKTLSNIIKDSATNVVNQVFKSSSYIDRNLLYRYAFSKKETEALPNGFIGYRIKIDDTKSIGLNITRLFLDFDGTGDITILLFNSAKKEVVKQQQITIDSDHKEIELNWYLNDTDSLYKGEYFIGYIKVDALSPFKRDYEQSNVMSFITHLDIDKIIVPNHATNTLFDLNDVEFLNENTGLNLDITVFDDYTDLVIQNRFLFARAVHLSAVISCLQIYMASLRSNSNERNANALYNKIILEIEGSKGNESVISVKGLKSQLIGEITEIKQTVQGIKEGYLGTGYHTITQS